MPDRFAPVFPVARFQAFQPLTLLLQLVRHDLHVQGQLFHRRNQCADLLHLLFQCVDPVILPVVLCGQTLVFIYSARFPEMCGFVAHLWNFFCFS